MNYRDPLTYRYPRTSIQAFGCDAYSAKAIHHYRRPLSQLVAKFITMLLLAGGLVVAALAYFGVLVP